MKAVILAAGKGTRLYPLTDKTPKPVLPVGGRPLLEWMLDRVKEAEINEVLIVTNYLEDQIMDRRPHRDLGKTAAAHFARKRKHLRPPAPFRDISSPSYS